MNFKSYQEQSKRTCASLGDEKLDLAHMTLGMGSELSELQHAIEKGDVVNVGEELADYQWYLSNYTRLRGYEYMEYSPAKHGDTFMNLELFIKTSQLQDMTKKYVAYGKVIDEDSERELIAEVSAIISRIYIDFELDESEYLQKNIDKLRARFPDLFDAELAINRDIETERKILEG